MGARSSHETYLQLGDGSSPQVYATVGAVTDLSGPGLHVDMADVTSLADTCRRKIPAIRGAVKATIKMLYDPDDATHEDLLDALAGKSVQAFLVSWPDFSNSVAATIVLVTDVLTTGAAHGWCTGRPVRFHTTGTLPASTPQVAEGVTYFARRTGADTLTLHPTNADAVAGTNAINFTADTTPALHTLLSSEAWTFSAFVADMKTRAAVGAALEADLELEVTDSVTT